MRSEQIVDALARLDEAVPTHRWIVGRLHALPLFRYEVYTRNHSLQRRDAAGAPGRARAAVHALERGLRARWQDRGASARMQRADVLLFSDGVSFVRLGERYYDRFCDPLRERLEARGLRTLLLTPLDTYFWPRHSSSSFVQHEIDRARMRAMLASRVTRPRVVLPGYDQAIATLRERYSNIVVPEPHAMFRSAVYIETYAALYTRWLERVRPRAVYLVCYYGAERFAMVLAARRMGIPTIDIQHGYSGELHWGYARWQNVPVGGYELLPRWFWCWSESERASISQWASLTSGAHDVRVGGNPFATMWRQDEAPMVAEHDRRIERLLSRHRGRTPVLYAANGLETEQQIRRFAKIVRDTKDQFFWYFRLHPCRAVAPGQIDATFRSEGATAIDVENATNLPLYALLRHVSLHVTESSTTVMEASEFGVPSVLAGASEAPSFQQYVDSGWLRVADDLETLPEHMATQLGRRESLRAALPPDTEPPGLEALLSIGGRRNGGPPISHESTHEAV